MSAKLVVVAMLPAARGSSPKDGLLMCAAPQIQSVAEPRPSGSECRHGLLGCIGPLSGSVATLPAEQGREAFRVQCPTAAIRQTGQIITCVTGTVVTPRVDQAAPRYTGSVVRTDTPGPDRRTFPALTFSDSEGIIKCRQTSGGDGYMTEAEGKLTFLFAFDSLSGFSTIFNTTGNEQTGRQVPAVFYQPYCDPARPLYSGEQPNPYCNGPVGSDDQFCFTTPDGRAAVPASLPSKRPNSFSSSN
jgi:hypothetical protein